MRIEWNPKSGEDYPSAGKNGGQLDIADADRLDDGTFVWELSEDSKTLNRKNSKLVQTRISNDSYARLDVLAQAEGMTIAEYLRRMIIKEVEK